MTAGFAGSAGFSPSPPTHDPHRVEELGSNPANPSNPAAAYLWFTGVLLAAGSGRRGTCWQCPAHADADPSLSVDCAGGTVLLFCHGGCGYRTVCAALAMRPGYLFTPPPVDPVTWVQHFCPDLTFPPLAPRTSRSDRAGYVLAGVHDYGPAHRLLRYRKGDLKAIEWETWRGGCWVPGLLGTPTSALPLYRENEIMMAVAAEEPVLLVESESSADALPGYYATTWAGGASTPQLDRLQSVLGDYPHLIVIPDHDPPGLACLDRLAGAGLAPHVVLPAPGEDARDLYQRLEPQAFIALLRGTS